MRVLAKGPATVRQNFERIEIRQLHKGRPLYLQPYSSSCSSVSRKLSRFGLRNFYVFDVKIRLGYKERKSCLALS